MSQVVRALDSLDESSDLSNGMRPGQSEIFDSRQHSAQIRMFQRMAFRQTPRHVGTHVNPAFPFYNMEFGKS
ncbi:hypothetical protein OIU84_014696 [Salix udensis]|uniref:Uncharacterized protein n=1 Tax=Salix udensis TaxID=889485 RepID=A0AAD6NS92_9ROSI|nr:hypothetical protein OIU84_014696 [Salix udensis]